MEQQPDLDALYEEAQAALASKDLQRAGDLLKQVLLIDENFKDASRLLAQVVAHQRRRWYRGKRLWGGLGFVVLVAVGGLLVNRHLAAYPSQVTPAASETSSAALDDDPTIKSLITTPTKVPTAKVTSVPMGWKRLYTGEAFARDRITAIVVDPLDPEVLYAGTENAGIYKTIDGAISWAPAHRGLGAVRIDTLLIDPANPRILYAGVRLQGVFRSSDGATSWERASDGLDVESRGWLSLLVMDPQDSSHLYYVGGSMGVYETTDGARLWTRVWPDVCPKEITSLAIHPLDGRQLFATVFGDQECAGLYISRDGGRSWVLTGLEGQGAWPNNSLWIDPVRGDYLFVEMKEGQYRSSDGGQTWSEWPYACTSSVGFDRGDPLVAYAYCAGGGQFVRTKDGGLKWEMLTLKGGPAGTVKVSPHASGTIYVGSSGFYLSNDGGTTWAERGSGLPAARLELRSDPRTSSTLYIEDAGCRLYRSADSGAGWEYVTDRGCGLAFDANGEVLYRAEGGGKGLLRSVDEGASWEVRPFPEDSGGWDVNVAAHPEIPGLVYALYGGPDKEGKPPYIYFSRDGGDTWEAATGGEGPNTAPGLFFDAVTSQRVYAVSEGGFVVHRSSDTGKTWQSCGWPEALFPDSASRFAIHPLNRDVIMLATRGKGIARSEDACQSWEFVDAGPGSLFVNSVVFDPTDPDTVYAGTDGGAFVSFDGGQSWGPINDGLLGATVVYSIVVDPQSNVYAATPYGVFKLEAR